VALFCTTPVTEVLITPTVTLPEPLPWFVTVPVLLTDVVVKVMPAFVELSLFKIKLLKKLGFDSDGTFVLTNNGVKQLDKYTNEPIKVNNMFIFPGSTIVLDNNPLSISSFLEEYEDAT